MSTDVLTLGSTGVVSDPDRKIDYLMCTFFFAKYSQTVYYPDRVTSLTKIIQLWGDNPDTIRAELESSLRIFLQKWFTTASVLVSVEDSGDDPGINLSIEAIVSDGTSVSPNSRSVGYSLYTRDSTLKQLIDISNGTVIYQAA